MDESSRATQRRRRWSGGGSKALQRNNLEQQFWASTSSAERLAAVHTMAIEFYRNTHDDDIAPRLDRTVGGLRKA